MNINVFRVAKNLGCPNQLQMKRTHDGEEFAFISSDYGIGRLNLNTGEVGAYFHCFSHILFKSSNYKFM